MKTTNQIEIAAPRDKVVQLYTCTDTLPLWSPGFISIELICDGSDSGGPSFRQRYRALGRDIDELITILDHDPPRGLHLLAQNESGTLTRESRITFDELDAKRTRVSVENQFSGEHLPYLVQQELHGYTQSFLETFKAFVQSS